MDQSNYYEQAGDVIITDCKFINCDEPAWPKPPRNRPGWAPLKPDPFMPLAAAAFVLLGVYLGNWFLSAVDGLYDPYWLQVSAPALTVAAYSAWREFRLKHGV